MDAPLVVVDIVTFCVNKEEVPDAGLNVGVATVPLVPPLLEELLDELLDDEESPPN